MPSILFFDNLFGIIRLVSMLIPPNLEMEAEYERYLAELTNLSLEKLNKEPERLSQVQINQFDWKIMKNFFIVLI